MAIEVVVPVPRAPRETPGVPLAPVRPLCGDVVVGLVDNSKHRARDVLVEVAERLIEQGLAGSYSVWTKSTASRPITADERTDLAGRADVVIAGVGD